MNIVLIRRGACLQEEGKHYLLRRL